ncbi:MAG TPA: mandelate racemase/muconate lactonizing enzyme family protein [Thermomicrobiales bacterium]|nr:mandelate racemase/muconate lactonizing enzyme family protein [Thermomicrobiales bacterium]
MRRGVRLALASIWGGSFVVRITEVSTLKLRFSMTTPMADAIHYMPERNLLLVQITTDDGLVGLGECAAYGGSLDSMERVVLDDLQPSLIGEDPFQVERLWSRMARRSHQRGTTGMLMQAISGVDIALWDLIGQATRTPLYRLLGGYRDTLEAYASAGFYAGGKGLAELAEEVGGYAERGFRTVKMKVGRNPEVMLNPLPDMWAPDYATVSLDEDVERVRAARAAIGPDVRLAIDANNAWTPSVAIQFMRRVVDQNIYWLEEPVATDDLAGSAEVARSLDMPVAGYETATGLASFRDLIAQRAVDIVQPDVIWTGGITVCRKVAALAQAYGLPVVPHVFSSAVAAMANMHFIASLPNGGLLEFDQNPNVLRSELFEEAIEVGSDGMVRLPERPGLGVSLNQAIVDRYRLA